MQVTFASSRLLRIFTQRPLFGSILVATLIPGCREANQYQPPPPPEVVVTTPVQRDVKLYLQETGTTRPVQRVEVRARVTGFLNEVLFEPGTFVDKGATLYRIEKQEFEAREKAAKAELESAKAVLEKAQIEYDRQLELKEKNATSDNEVTAARAFRDTSQAGVLAAEAALDQAEIDLGYTDVQAPIEGRVGETLVKVGNLVSGTESTKLTDLVQYDPIHVYFNISEADLLRISEQKRTQQSNPPPKDQGPVGMPVMMARAVDEAFPFEGAIDYFDLAVEESTGTYQIRAVFDNAARRILPGLFVRVRVPIGELKQALLVPETALGTDQGGQYLLLVGQDNLVQRRYVREGPVEDGMVVIAEGLQPGERVIAEGLQRARPGTEVIPVAMETTTESEIRNRDAATIDGEQQAVDSPSGTTSVDSKNR